MIEISQRQLRRRVDDRGLRASPELWTLTAQEWARAAETKPGTYLRAATFAECKRNWVRRTELMTP